MGTFMLVKILELADEKSDFILGEKRLGKVIDFLNGFTVSPKNNLLIVFDRKQYCLDVSEGKDLSCNIMSVLLNKSKNEFDAYKLFYKYLSDEYEDIKKKEVSLNIAFNGIYDSPICCAMATLYNIPGFVLDNTCFSSLIAFFYGYIFGFEVGQMKTLSALDLEKIFCKAKGSIEELNSLVNSQLDDKQQWDDFFIQYSINLKEKKGEDLDEIFYEKKQHCLNKHYFW